jgi:branched-chain amino acid transport system permease protein
VKRLDVWKPIAAFAALASAAAFPFVADGFYLALGVSVLSYVALATAWALFSGPTRYISLATAAFFGAGIYALAIGHSYFPIPLVLAAAAVAGFLVALVVGLSTLRLRGVYFVVFTFGLTELVRQIVNWWEIRNGTVTRFIFIDVSHVRIYETLLAVAVITVVGSWYVGRTRLGFALRAIGEDETVARHTGINTTMVKILCFAASAAVMALVGAVFQLQHNYVDANTAFNNSWSFQVLIAALLGGPGRAWGPALGAILLLLLSEYFSGAFAGSFPIALGLCFVVIVYFLPGGIAPLLERYYGTFDKARVLQAFRTGRLPRTVPAKAGIRGSQFASRLKLSLARLNGFWRM